MIPTGAGRRYGGLGAAPPSFDLGIRPGSILRCGTQSQPLVAYSPQLPPSAYEQQTAAEPPIVVSEITDHHKMIGWATSLAHLRVTPIQAEPRNAAAFLRTGHASPSF